ncbi:MAG: ABC transporter ATP-binding protein [Deltaproteobacteria bacterium]|jgi:iron complex transport system ATP-binding protein|nr:ABC transporter ATP-binding protein [Deltaproteobacteria bacterium]
MIDIRQLNFSYRPGSPVLAGISACLRKGQVVSVLGPNGCGKTTLLKAVLGFLPVSCRTIFIDEKPLESFSRPALARILAYVPQSHGSVFAYQVRDMVLMGRTGCRRFGGFSAKDQQKAQEALDLVRISHLARRSFPELSGGQQQLVIIARALAQDSSFIFMDEPTSGLDLANQTLVLKTMKKLHEERGLSFLMTTHHPEQAVYLGGQVLMMKAGQVKAAGEARKLTTARMVEELYDLSPGLLTEMGLVPSGLDPN